MSPIVASSAPTYAFLQPWNLYTTKMHASLPTAVLGSAQKRHLTRESKAEMSARAQSDSPGSKPLAGSSSPVGASSLISLPSAPTRVSFSGLKVRSPAMAKAVTSSGEVTKAWVAGLPSLRAAKLRL